LVWFGMVWFDEWLEGKRSLVFLCLTAPSPPLIHAPLGPVMAGVCAALLGGDQEEVRGGLVGVREIESREKAEMRE